MSDSIAVTSPHRGFLAHREEIEGAVRRVLESGRYILGSEVEAFETEFAAWLGIREAVGVGSGTEALHLALRCLGIGAGDLVATVAHTAVATVAAIELSGALPVFVDVDPLTMTLSPDGLSELLGSPEGARVKAVVPVHLYGCPADLPRILEIARRHGVRVIEDAAQAHGAAIQGRRVGAFGDFAAFSFYPTKNLGGFGDGGAVTTADPVLAEKARMLRQYGWRERFVSECAGLNTRLDEVQAAVLRVKLAFLDRENERRAEIYWVYERELAATGLRLPTVSPGVRHVFHQYVVRTPDRDRLAAFLQEHGVATAIHYPVPVHLQPGYRDRFPGVRLPQTEAAAGSVLSLPMHAHLSDNEVARVCALVLKWRPRKRDEPPLK